MAMDEKKTQQLMDWIRKSDKPMQSRMVEFPPASKVRSVEGMKLHYPAPGVVGQVCGYNPPSNSYNGVSVLVVVPEGAIGECEPQWIEIIEYTDGITPEFVKMAAGIEDAKT